MSERTVDNRFAGIEDVERLGFGVEENARRLHRLAYVEQRLMFIAAGHLLSVPEWEAKFLLGRHMYEDAEHHQAFRTRIGELRRSEHSVDTSPDPALTALMDEAIRAADGIELLTGIYRVLKPALVAAYRAHGERINPLVDYSTGRTLRLTLPEEAEHVAQGQRYIETLLTGEAERAHADAWANHLTAYLAAAGGLSGTETRRPAADLPTPRADGQPWVMPERSGRDARFQVSVPKPPTVHVPDRGDPVREGLEQMMWVRFHEMSPAETVAAIMTRQKDRPWEFYRDLARHCWDEVRHSAFGQAALQAEGIDITSNPNWTGFATMCLSELDPIQAYTHLTVAIEQAAMKYPPGKRQEYEFCRDKAQHPLMALYQDYDWADEVIHSHFGQEWIIRREHAGDRKAAIAAGAATMDKRIDFMSQFSTDGTVPDPYAGRRGTPEKGSASGY
ncbi:MAG: hypothetical protein MUC51_18200 [Anaerolineae bacterium]|nr:hypothetical protein [Anaerolineae bacterium]